MGIKFKITRPPSGRINFIDSNYTRGGDGKRTKWEHLGLKRFVDYQIAITAGKKGRDP